MKIFQNGQFVEMPKDHKIYRLLEEIRNRQIDKTEGGDENE